MTNLKKFLFKYILALQTINMRTTLRNTLTYDDNAIILAQASFFFFSEKKNRNLIMF